MERNQSLTPVQVAGILNIAKNTVYELVKRGELNAYLVGKKMRIDPSDLDEYKLRSRRKAQASPKKDLSVDNFSGAPQKAGAEPVELVISGQDSMLDILARNIESLRTGIHPLRSQQGSYNGLYALYQGQVHAATAHLWDGDTDTYNLPYVRRMLPGIPAIVIHLACRVQGFYVKKGNPKHILSWKDVIRGDISIVNREKGSGTRVLLDEQLRLTGAHGSSIEGYDLECVSHLSVASAVARGSADLGFGSENAARQVRGIEFIPMKNERYELVIRKEDLRKKGFPEMLAVIRSEGFRDELEGLGGYDLADIGKVSGET
jgi:putative molybdopterin biosynthesis protein